MATILVYGATGPQGRAVTLSLLGRGHRVLCLVRDPTRASDLLGRGAEIRIGDLADRRSLARASEGVDTVVSILPLSFNDGIMLSSGVNVIAAAEDAAVPFLIHNMGVCAPERSVGYHFFDVLRRITDRVLGARIPTLVLRPPLYLDNLLAPWTLPHLEKHDVVSYPLPGEVAVPWLSHRNLGAYITAAVGRVDLTGRVLDITDGTERSGEMIAEAMSRHLGRPVGYEAIPTDLFASRVAALLGATAGSELAEHYNLLTANECDLLRGVSNKGVRALQPELEEIDEFVSRSFAATPH